MTTLDAATCNARLQIYLDAEAAILLGQSVEVAGRRLTHANLAEVRQGITDWNQRLQAATRAEAGGRRCVNAAPTF